MATMCPRGNPARQYRNRCIKHLFFRAIRKLIFTKEPLNFGTHFRHPLAIRMIYRGKRSYNGDIIHNQLTAALVRSYIRF